MHVSSSDRNEASVLHQALVDELKSRDLLRDPAVEKAFRAAPRHLFLPDVSLEDAYSDRAIPTKRDENGQCISSSSQPAMMAYMLAQLDLEPGHRVLEIGTGTGYNAALMSYIVGDEGHVVTIDVDEDIVQTARLNLESAGIDAVHLDRADGGYGYPDLAPYDRIIVTAAADDIPSAWHEQLQPDGRLVLPLIVGGPQVSVAFVPVNNHLTTVSVLSCGFMDLRGDFAPESGTRLQLGPTSGLVLEVDRSDVDAETVYTWLTDPRERRSVHTQTTPWEIWHGLGVWLKLQGGWSCELTATGELVDRGMIPRLFNLSGGRRSCHTLGVFGHAGLCVLARSPDLPVPENSTMWNREPFELFVQCFGTDASLGDRLIEHVRAWDDAGRPMVDNAHLRAYSKDIDYVPSEAEFTIEKRWTDFILTW